MSEQKFNPYPEDKHEGCWKEIGSLHRQPYQTPQTYSGTQWCTGGCRTKTLVVGTKLCAKCVNRNIHRRGLLQT